MGRSRPISIVVASSVECGVQDRGSGASPGGLAGGVVKMSRSAAAAAILCVGVLLVSAGPLSAQASRLGNTVAVASQGLDSDVAYDSTHGVYLTTWGMWPVRARFVAAGGTPIGDAFQVPSANNAQTPRVAYAPGIDAFLVVWLDERTRDNRVR